MILRRIIFSTCIFVGTEFIDSVYILVDTYSAPHAKLLFIVFNYIITRNCFTWTNKTFTFANFQLTVENCFMDICIKERFIKYYYNLNESFMATWAMSLYYFFIESVSLLYYYTFYMRRCVRTDFYYECKASKHLTNIQLLSSYFRGLLIF